MNMQYLPNPMIQGIGQFFAGFGQRRQEVKAIEAQQAQLQNQQWGQAIGSGLQTAGQLGAMGLMDSDHSIHSLPPMQRASILGSMMPGLAPAARQMGDFAGEQMRFQNQQTLQQGVYDRMMDLEDRRTENDQLERVLEQFDAAAGFPTVGRGRGRATAGGMGGMAPPFAMGGGGPSPDGTIPGAIGMNEDGSPIMGPPPTGVPPPGIEPSSMAAYRQNQAEYDSLVNTVDDIRGDTDLPPAERIARIAPLIPKMQQVYQSLWRQSAPPPPKTQADLTNNGELIILDDGSFATRGPKGELNITKRADAVPDTYKAWSALPPGDPNRAVLRDRYIRDNFVGSYDDFVARGGYGTIDPATGKVTFEEPKSTGESEAEKTQKRKESVRDAAVKAANAYEVVEQARGKNGEKLTDEKTGVPVTIVRPPTPKEKQKFIEDYVRSYENVEMTQADNDTLAQRKKQYGEGYGPLIFGLEKQADKLMAQYERALANGTLSETQLGDLGREIFGLRQQIEQKMIDGKQFAKE